MISHCKHAVSLVFCLLSVPLFAQYSPPGGGGGSGGTVTTVGFTGGLVSVANPTTTPALTVAGTSGGIPYFSGASTWTSSAALTANALIKGGGAGASPVATGCAVDGSNNLTCPGSVTSGSSGGTTGAMDISGLTSGKITLSVLDAAGTWTMKLPPNAGTNNYALITDGSGNTSWAAQTGSGGTSIGAAVGSGTSGSVLYVDGSGNLAQLNASLFFNATNKTLHAGATSDGGLIGNVAGNTGFGGLWVGGNVVTPSFTNYAVLDEQGGATAFNSSTFADFDIANVRQMRMSAGFILPTLGIYTGCTHGTNGTCGMATLSSGTVTVSSTKACTLAASGAGGCAVKLTLQTCSTCGTLSVGTVTNGTSFVINSTNAGDASLVYWYIDQI
jgi:hypothetical protein